MMVPVTSDCALL